MALNLPEDKFTTVKGVRTRYWAEGQQGSVVILIHGLGGFIESWMYNIGPLAEHHRVYALDLLGFGQTDKTPLIRDMKMLVGFIRDFAVTLNIDKASLIGNSLGGGLALQFALEYPQKVSKLVLVDNAGMGREVCVDFRFCALPVINSFFVRPGRNNVERLLETLVYDASVITPEFKEFSNRYNSVEGAGKALLATLRAGLNIFGQKSKLTRQLLERLHTIEAPTLIIWGNHDRIIPVAHAHIAAKKIPHARLAIFDNCGHMPMLEQPEKFNRIVLEFLNE